MDSNSYAQMLETVPHFFKKLSQTAMEQVIASTGKFPYTAESGMRLATADGTPLYFISFSKRCQHPAKPFYEEKMASVFEKLVSAGKVESFLSAGKLALAGGYIVVGPGKYRDLGPDHDDCLYFFCFSKEKQEDIEKFLGVSHNTTICPEGMIGNDSWWELCEEVDGPWEERLVP